MLDLGALFNVFLRRTVAAAAAAAQKETTSQALEPGLEAYVLANR